MARRRGRRQNRNSKKQFLFIGIGIILLGIVLIGGSMLLEYFSTTSKQGKEVVIEIEQGEGIWDIAGKLKKADLIDHKTVFLLKAKTMGASSKLRYGTFTLYEGLSLEDTIALLITGGAQKEEAQLTIPEGYTIEKMAVAVEEAGFCTADEFLAAVEKDYDYWFLESIPEDAAVIYRLQGFLYPDTYAIADDMTAEEIVAMMLEQFGKKYTKEMEAQANAMGMTTFELITKASIVERETRIPEERTIVAGVMENRLEKGMALQVCPSVLYPLTNGIYDKTTVTYEDTRLDSPYNTYQNKGLPVGPIASPGLPCIEAVLEPAEHDYLFYHTNDEKNDGSHIFTKTYKEHTNTQ